MTNTTDPYRVDPDAVDEAVPHGEAVVFISDPYSWSCHDCDARGSLDDDSLNRAKPCPTPNRCGCTLCGGADRIARRHE